ncbi:MAG TPA: glycosyltransferase [Bryobacteraceae bacterium]|nr:glycosyltransferase [Bryobacteraceae bacterium]
MKLAIFGLSISSSWGNGHATLWRGLVQAMVRRGYEVHFFERDVPWYAQHRDLTEIDGGRLHLYSDWQAILPLARAVLKDADVGMVTSYCPDGVPATDLVTQSNARVRCFYDLDAPVTLHRLQSGEPVEYIGPRRLRDFDLVLSYTGGRALEDLRSLLGARNVAPLYGSVDPGVHRPAPAMDCFRADMSYLGTFAADRQATLEKLFIEPARRVPNRRFVMGGAMYPQEFPWTNNIYFVRHLAPEEHASFYCSSKVTLNITRAAMAEMGYCPSGRLFEAAACGTPVLSDWWEGLDQFFTPGSEILVAHDTEDALAALDLSEGELQAIGRRARERALDEHTADHRLRDFERILEEQAVEV